MSVANRRNESSPPTHNVSRQPVEGVEEAEELGLIIETVCLDMGSHWARSNNCCIMILYSGFQVHRYSCLLLLHIMGISAGET